MLKPSLLEWGHVVGRRGIGLISVSLSLNSIQGLYWHGKCVCIAKQVKWIINKSEIDKKITVNNTLTKVPKIIRTFQMSYYLYIYSVVMMCK
jgi:hypothetical protein